jgi:hypothetical protein
MLICKDSGGQQIFDLCGLELDSVWNNAMGLDEYREYTAASSAAFVSGHQDHSFSEFLESPLWNKRSFDSFLEYNQDLVAELDGLQTNYMNGQSIDHPTKRR